MSKASRIATDPDGSSAGNGRAGFAGRDGLCVADAAPRYDLEASLLPLVCEKHNIFGLKQAWHLHSGVGVFGRPFTLHLLFLHQFHKQAQVRHLGSVIHYPRL